MSILQNGLIFRREHVSYVSAQVRGHLRLPAVGKVDDVHFLDPRRRDGRDVANHFKYLANTFPVTFIYVGVGLERRGLVSEGLAAGEEELAQNARRWTTLGVSPFEITTEAGRPPWRPLLLATEKDPLLARHPPAIVAAHLPDSPFAPTPAPLP